MVWLWKILKNKLLFTFQFWLFFIFLGLCLSIKPSLQVNSQPDRVKQEIYFTSAEILPQNNLEIYDVKDESNFEIPTFLTTREILLSFSVLSFGILVVFLEFQLIKSVKNKIEPQDILLIFTVTLILVGTLFLITSGHSSQQIAPVLGLFGTIIGYLLGRETEKMLEKKARSDNQDVE